MAQRISLIEYQQNLSERLRTAQAGDTAGSRLGMVEKSTALDEAEAETAVAVAAGWVADDDAAAAEFVTGFDGDGSCAADPCRCALAARCVGRSKLLGARFLAYALRGEVRRDLPFGRSLNVGFPTT